VSQEVAAPLSLGLSVTKWCLLGFAHLEPSKPPLGCFRRRGRDLEHMGDSRARQHFCRPKGNSSKILCNETAKEEELKKGPALGVLGVGDSHRRVPACLRNLARCGGRRVMA